ncbi:MAG: hypothetical protein AUJ75_01560 [Candidatus Omnitrophica bacterium CG1_02_49_10]|nr:MAG: hypothetical protein AUJ75_01560 [Candidatus Omnitrophica bacterium CG1_02_49_10]
MFSNYLPKANILVLGLFVSFLCVSDISYARPPAARPFGEKEKALVYRDRRDEEMRFKELGIPIIEEYKNYYLLEASPEEEAEMEAKELRLRRLPRANLIELGDAPFDPLEGKGPRAAGLNRRLKGKFFSFAGRRKVLYLVQFIGPIKKEWLDELKDAGIKLVSATPNFAYTVYGPQRTMLEAEEKPFVRSTYPYSPQLKLERALRLQDKAKEESELLLLVLDEPGAADGVVNMIARLGGEIENRRKIKEFERIRFKLSVERLSRIAAIPEVYHIQRVFKKVLLDEVSDQISAGNYVGGVPFTGYNTWLGTLGLDGTGVTIGVVDDGGVDNSEVHLAGRVTDKSNGLRRNPLGHGHHVAGIAAGQCSHTDGSGFAYALGMAPQSSVINQSFDNFDDVNAQYTVTTAGTNGVKGNVQNNSWGYTPTPSSYTYWLQDWLQDVAVRDADPDSAGNQELTVFFAAGNGGSSGIGVPAGAKNIVTVGASENYRPVQGFDGDNINHLGWFSSLGTNMADGRIKPDVVTPGTWIASARSGPNTLWGNIDIQHRWSSGTSQAAPHVTGAGALITQYGIANFGGAPSPALIKALLINSAVDMTGAGAPGPIPNVYEGWGRVDLSELVDPLTEFIFRNQETIFRYNSQNFKLGIQPANQSKPMKVTLVWTDAPGMTNSTKHLINDLDLTLSQNGTIYYGNKFSGGWSTSGGSADSKNNVENVYIQSPSGVYELEVSASALSADGVPGDAIILDQDFALVIQNGAEVTGSTLMAEGPGGLSVSGPATWSPPYLYGDITITNNTAGAINNAIARIEWISDGGVTVNNPDGYVGGDPYFYYGDIASGAGSYRLFEFNNPGSVPFDFAFSVYADP